MKSDKTFHVDASYQGDKVKVIEFEAAGPTLESSLKDSRVSKLFQVIIAISSLSFNLIFTNRLNYTINHF